jgi:hypothetical protein
MTWEWEQPSAVAPPPAIPAQSDAIGVDAETTLLPPGLLDSPPHQTTTQPSPAIDTLCEDCIIPPPAPLLSASPRNITPYPPKADDTMAAEMPPPSANDNLAPMPEATPELPEPLRVSATPATAQRRSVRLAARPAGSADLAAWARDTKLKKLGLVDEAKEEKAPKKRQLLQAYTGAGREVAEEAVHELLGI